MSSIVQLILSLFDHSGNWSKPYLDAGYEVAQIDLQHGQDARLLPYFKGGVHGILAAPPCTAFAASGAQYWKAKDAAGELLEALALVDACMRAVVVYQPKWWVLENPVGRLTTWLGPPAFKFQPSHFGDPYTKTTYLWGKFNLPKLNAVRPIEGSRMHTKFGGGSGQKRSITPQGFARAFFDANP